MTVSDKKKELSVLTKCGMDIMEKKSVDEETFAKIAEAYSSCGGDVIFRYIESQNTVVANSAIIIKNTDDGVDNDVLGALAECKIGVDAICVALKTLSVAAEKHAPSENIREKGRIANTLAEEGTKVSYLMYSLASMIIEAGSTLYPDKLSPRKKSYVKAKNGDVWGPPPDVRLY